jgi:NAD(P)-dependent dehydrogenase (short-subunit alcohol dehydrogenase family)
MTDDECTASRMSASLIRCSAIEAVEYRVRINAVSPGIARHKFLDKTTSSDLLDRLSAGEAFGRAAEPWEVAATIAFCEPLLELPDRRGDLGLLPAPVSRSAMATADRG